MGDTKMHDIAHYLFDYTINVICLIFLLKKSRYFQARLLCTAFLQMEIFSSRQLSSWLGS